MTVAGCWRWARIVVTWICGALSRRWPGPWSSPWPARSTWRRSPCSATPSSAPSPVTAGELVAVDLDGVSVLDDTGLGILLGSAGRAAARTAATSASSPATSGSARASPRAVSTGRSPSPTRSPACSPSGADLASRPIATVWVADSAAPAAVSATETWGRLRHATSAGEHPVARRAHGERPGDGVGTAGDQVRRAQLDRDRHVRRNAARTAASGSSPSPGSNRPLSASSRTPVPRRVRRGSRHVGELEVREPRRPGRGDDRREVVRGRSGAGEVQRVDEHPAVWVGRQRTTDGDGGRQRERR